MKLNGIKIAVSIKVESASSKKAELKNFEIEFESQVDSCDISSLGEIFGRRDEDCQ